jgi:hypothetical protein
VLHNLDHQETSCDRSDRDHDEGVQAVVAQRRVDSWEDGSPILVELWFFPNMANNLRGRES